MLPLGGLHPKLAVKHGIWVPTQHLPWERGKPQKTLIELEANLYDKLNSIWNKEELPD
jgi:hypothetical protein